MSTINIDPDAMQAIVADAILKGVGDEQRDLILKQAVSHLITPPATGSYGQKGPSPLQNAFNSAVSSAAYAVVREMMDEPTTKALIDTAIREQVTAVLDRGDWMRDAIASAIGNNIADIMRRERDRD